MSSPTNLCLGISLGTTYTRAAVAEDDLAEIVLIEDSRREMPTVVAFTPEERLIGRSAVYQADTNVQNTLFAVGRLVGCKVDDKIVKQEAKYRPLQSHQDPEKNLQLCVRYKDKTINLYPEEILAMVLFKLNQSVKKSLNLKGGSIDAIITVPAVFSTSQRHAIKVAGTLAGFQVKHILSDTTAAAVLYQAQRKPKGEETLLVFHLGGGTLGVSLFKVMKDNLEVQAVAGDSHLGGEDFTSELVEHCAAEFAKKREGQEIFSNYRALHQFREKAEKLKAHLVGATEGRIEVKVPADKIAYTGKLKREKFEELCKDNFDKCINCLKDVLRDAKVDKAKVDRVILVGGSSRIPKLQQLIQEFFEKERWKAIHYSAINAEDAVALGAAFFGATQSKLNVHEVCVSSWRFQEKNGPNHCEIRTNARLPYKQSTSLYKGSRTFDIQLWEGDNLLCEENVGPNLPEPCRLELAIDEYGTASATFYERPILPNLKKDEIKMRQTAEKFAEDEEARGKAIEAKNNLEKSFTNLSDRKSPSRELKVLIDEADKLLNREELADPKEYNELQEKLEQHRTQVSLNGAAREGPNSASNSQRPETTTSSSFKHQYSPEISKDEPKAYCGCY